MKCSLKGVEGLQQVEYLPAYARHSTGGFPHTRSSEILKSVTRGTVIPLFPYP